MKKNKPQLQSRGSKEKYIPPKVMPLNDALVAKTACGLGSGAGGCGPCVLCCNEGSGPAEPVSI